MNIHNDNFYCVGHEMEKNIHDARNKERVPLPWSLGVYFRVHGFIPEGGLLKASKGDTRKICRLFGERERHPDMEAMYSDRKYTHDYTIERIAGSGEFYTLYRCYGEWRVGGLPKFCPHVGELLEILCPRAHCGWSKVLPDRIVKEGLFSGVLAPDNAVAEPHRPYSDKDAVKVSLFADYDPNDPPF